MWEVRLYLSGDLNARTFLFPSPSYRAIRAKVPVKLLHPSALRRRKGERHRTAFITAMCVTPS